ARKDALAKAGFSGGRLGEDWRSQTAIRSKHKLDSLARARSSRAWPDLLPWRRQLSLEEQVRFRERVEDPHHRYRGLGRAREDDPVLPGRRFFLEMRRNDTEAPPASRLMRTPPPTSPATAS